MSSHADTIRNQSWPTDALAALDALLAENQRLKTDLDRTTTAGNRIEQQLVEAASVMTKLRAENQRLREDMEIIAGPRTLSIEKAKRIAREALAGDADG